jgi:LPXTG-motif cell wall-anchored protein
MTHRLLLAITMLLSLALPAMAADGVHSFDDFAIPNPTRPETARTLLTVDTSEHAGETCQIVVDTANGPSVHPENYLTVEGGIPTITVTGTEDSDGGVHQSTSTVVMGDELHVVNHFALATSVEGRITIRCQPPTTTTITSPPSTTSSSVPTTTSVPDTSSSTSPPDSSTSSTSPASSTSSSVSPPSTIPPVSNPPATLPVTGPDGLVGWTVAGVALVLLGGFLVRAAREGER